MRESVRVVLDPGWAKKYFIETYGRAQDERLRRQPRRVLLVDREFNDERGNYPAYEITVYDGESMYGTDVMGGIRVGPRDPLNQDRYGGHASRE